MKKVLQISFIILFLRFVVRHWGAEERAEGRHHIDETMSQNSNLSGRASVWAKNVSAQIKKHNNQAN